MASTPPPRETVIAELMTSTKFSRHRTAFFQTGLPILGVALHVEEMTRLLAPLTAAVGLPPSVRYARLVAYKQGNRGLIRYDLMGDNGDAAVLGKLYPQAPQAARVHGILRSLSTSFTGADRLRVPVSLGCLDDLAMLVYVPVEGVLLEDAILAG
jgi:hypothetical protein